MKTIRLSGGRALTNIDLEREGSLPQSIIDSAAQIVATVRRDGDAALARYAEKFDGYAPASLRVPQELLDASLDQVDPAFLESLRRAAANIEAFHAKELEKSWFETRPDGTILGVKVTPLPSVGVYVPGGRAQYPSTVLMNVIPAKVAGVKRIVMVTPPQKNGSLSAYTLAAAKVAGVTELYATGGAQAIAALAYGTESIAPVAKITGPGNAYVAAAKKLVSGEVGIDMIAGPSEVCVLADSTADPVVVAADLMAQAEHDPLATCYFVTTDEALLEPLAAAVDAFCATSPRAEITRSSLDNRGKIVLCEDLDAAIAAVNFIAPEHLELHMDNAMNHLGKIENAGAIFVGPWSCEALGDYCAGPNHTLPTGGTAKFSNPLGTYDFVKRSSVIAYTPEGFAQDARDTRVMAQAEGLWAHALSAGMRLERVEKSDEGRIPADASSIAWPEPLSTPGVCNLDEGTWA
jgi:histidinol dehydrogenase